MNTIRGIPGLVCTGLVCFFYMYFYIYVFFELFSVDFCFFFANTIRILQIFEYVLVHLHAVHKIHSHLLNVLCEKFSLEIIIPKTQCEWGLNTTILSSWLFPWLSSRHGNCSSQKLLYQIDVLCSNINMEYLNLMKWWVDLASSICYVSL